MTPIACVLTIPSVLFIASGLPGPAQAQAIYKCTRAGQTAVYQNAPCASHQRIARSLAYIPDPDARPYRPDLRSRPDPVRLSGRRGATVRATQAADACEAARRNRDVVLGRNNQGGNVDVRRVLNDAVADACY